MLTSKFRVLSKRCSVQQQLIKHFQNPLVIMKKKIIFFFFPAVSSILMVCMDVQLIVIYSARMARKWCSFNETISYCTASNLNNCMAVWVCVRAFVCVRETERGERGRQWQWGDRSACKCKQGSSTELYYSATIIIVLLNMHSIQTCLCRVCLWVQYKKDSSFREFLSFLVLSISK